MGIGEVLWFSSRRGFGWIKCDDADVDGDAYVHFSDISGGGFRTLYDGQKVEFELVRQEKGALKAINVTGPNGKEIENDKKFRDDGYDDGGYDEYDDDNLMTGTVVSFRGSFGWISCDDGSGDAYVHFSDIKIKGNGYRKLMPGQNVEFVLIQQKGDKLKAVQVTATGGYDGSGSYQRGGYGGGRGTGRGRGRGRGRKRYYDDY